MASSGLAATFFREEGKWKKPSNAWGLLTTDYRLLFLEKYFLTMHPTRGKVFTTSNEEEKSSPLRPA